MTSRKAILLKPVDIKFYQSSTYTKIPVGTEINVAKGSLGYRAGNGWLMEFKNGSDRRTFPGIQGVDFKFPDIDTKGHKYVFEKFLRDCPYNKNLRKGEKAIYDYKILEDDVLIGYFKLTSRHGRGYEMYSIDNRAVKQTENGYYDMVRADTKSDFEMNVVEFRHRIPTAAQMEDHARQMQKKAEQEALEKKELYRKSRMNAKAEEMYDILKDFSNGGLDPELMDELKERAARIVLVIDTPSTDEY